MTKKDKTKIKNYIAQFLIERKDWILYDCSLDNNKKYWSGVARKGEYLLVILNKNEPWKKRFENQVEYENYLKQMDYYYAKIEKNYKAIRKFRESHYINYDYLITNNEKNNPKDLRRLEYLKNIRQDRGASAEEERSAIEKYNQLLKKNKIIVSPRNQKAFEVSMPEKPKKPKFIKINYPSFKPTPPNFSWHIEKDGKIIDTGRGLSRFAKLPDHIDISDLKYISKIEKNESSRKDELIKEYIDSKISNSFSKKEEVCKEYEIISNEIKLLLELEKIISYFDGFCDSHSQHEEKSYSFESYDEEKTKIVYEFKPDEYGKIEEGQCFKYNSKVYRFKRIGNGVLAAYKVLLSSNKNSKETLGFYMEDGVKEMNRNDYLNKSDFMKKVKEKKIVFGEIIEISKVYKKRHYKKNQWL